MEREAVSATTPLDEEEQEESARHLLAMPCTFSPEGRGPLYMATKETKERERDGRGGGVGGRETKERSVGGSRSKTQKQQRASAEKPHSSSSHFTGVVGPAVTLSLL